MLARNVVVAVLLARLTSSGAVAFLGKGVASTSESAGRCNEVDDMNVRVDGVAVLLGCRLLNRSGVCQ